MNRGRPDGQQHRHRVDVEDVDRTHREVGPAAQASRRECHVDGARRQDRRHGQAVHGPAGIGQDEEFRATPRGRHGVARQPVQGGRQPGRAGRRIPRRIERPARGPSLAHGRQQAREVRHDRPLQPNGPGHPRQPTQQRRSAPELHAQVHDDPLALRVDGRVGDLGERLTKMVGDRPVESTAARCRRVVAHAPERLVGVEGHRPDIEPGTFRIEPGEVAQDVVGRHGRGGDGVDAVLVDGPWRIMDGQRSERPGLRLGILEDRTPARIDEQQFARSEAPATDRLRSRERDGSGLRRNSDQTVASHGEGRRPQPVSIDQRAHPVPVGKDDRRGPVPRCEKPGRAAAKRGDVRMRRPTQRERFRDGGQQRRREIPAGPGEQLQSLVQRERIGAVRRE